jgi:radical SAM-linked protein
MQYISHLDVMRFWERALRRADIPVSYSEGFSPHAQISLAAPLAVGMTSEAELMDVFLAEPMQPREFMHRLSGQIPAGFVVQNAREVGLSLPALQADVRFAEYRVDVPPSGSSAAEIRQAIETFLRAESIAWEHKRENETRSYDIRAQVAELALETVCEEGSRGRVVLSMRLKNDNSGSGRPEQVVAALGLSPPTRIHRTKLVLAEQSKALQAWRKHGRPEA